MLLSENIFYGSNANGYLQIGFMLHERLPLKQMGQKISWDWQKKQKTSENISRTWNSHHVNLNIWRCIGCYIVWVINTCISAVRHLLAPVKHHSKWKITCSLLAMLHFLMLQYLQLAAAASARSPPVSSLWTDSVVGPQTAAGEQPRPAETTFSASECYMRSCVTSDVNS